MKIELSPEEFKTLLETLELSNWVLFANDPDIVPEKRKFDALEQKIYMHAKQFGFEHLIEYDNELKKYYPTRELEDSDGVYEYIQEYKATSFWEELIERLSIRDIIKNNDPEKLEHLKQIEQLEMEKPFQEKYMNEFEKYGIERLEIVGDVENDA